MSIHIILGGQYGSEGKGAIVAWMTDPAYLQGPILVIRTGGPNAGHSMKWQGGVYKMRHVPCAWHNPNAVLALGPGAVVDPEYLLNTELPELQRAGMDIKERFWIDPMCAVITEQDKREGAERAPRIGATGKGVGDATARRVLRIGMIAGQDALLQPYLRDVSELAHDWHQAGKSIVVESAQGYALSLTRSGFYPYATSRDVTPPAILNDAGLPICGHIVTTMVLRTHPIRVAGQSGPLANETTWEKLGEATGGHIKPELTTVTQKVRRVGLWDEELAKKAVQACHPDFIALTFFDYWRPDLAGKTTLDADAYRRISEVEKALGVPVVWVSTGFQDITTVRKGHQ